MQVLCRYTFENRLETQCTKWILQMIIGTVPMIPFLLIERQI